MWSSILALLVGLAIVIFSARHVGTQYNIYFDIVGVALVLGGTFVVAFIKFPAKEVFRLARVSLAVMRNDSRDAQVLAREIIAVARDTRGEVTALQGQVEGIRDTFLRESLTLIVDRLEPADIETIIKNRIRTVQETDESTANMLKALAKYPPSFGIIGTVLGLISLMLQLGDAGGAEKLGPSMAVGLVATLYGLVLTNFVLQPLAENLAFKSYLEVQKLQMVLVGVLLMRMGRPVFVIQEAVNSLLPAPDRVDVLGGQGGNGSGQARGSAA